MHLANMTSGYMRAEAPGAAWAYNDYAMKLLHVTLFDNVFQEASPNAAALINERLGSLNFQDGSIYGPARDGYGVETSCRDMARIGWFWMNKGNWNGAQMLPESWFNTYMQAQVAGTLPRTTGTDANGDYLTVGSYGGGTDQSAIGPNIYGFGWWFNNALGETSNLLFPSGPADLIMANGHFTTEVMFVIPSLGLVFANYSTSWGNLLTDAGVEDSTSDQLVAMIAATVL
jgi:CubicO group peptidase (beta-lactamase class C family)